SSLLASDSAASVSSRKQTYVRGHGAEHHRSWRRGRPGEVVFGPSSNSSARGGNAARRYGPSFTDVRTPGGRGCSLLAVGGDDRAGAGVSRARLVSPLGEHDDDLDGVAREGAAGFRDRARYQHAHV